MIIGIDASSANQSHRTGVHGYAYHLIQAMKSCLFGPKDRVRLYSPSPLKEELAFLPEGWTSQVLSWPFSRGWMQGRMSWEMWRRSPNVFFVPAQGLPRWTPHHPKKHQVTVTTIHDVGFRRYPELYSSAARRRLEYATHHAIKKAQRIFVPSVFTKQELMELYHVSETQIAVTPLAVDQTRYRLLDRHDIDPVLSAHRLSFKNYFFTIGRVEKKKNSDMLIRAFDLFKKNRGLGDPFHLVFAGSPGFGFAQIKAFADASPFKDAIRFLGWVKEEDLPALMSGAAAYLFPSHYEGFGIPNLEALACGTPLITSDLPVHREVAGEAARFVSPKDSALWENAMRETIGNPFLTQALVSKGFDELKRFSWDKTAKLTLESMFSLFS